MNGPAPSYYVSYYWHIVKWILKNSDIWIEMHSISFTKSHLCNVDNNMPTILGRGQRVKWVRLVFIYCGKAEGTYVLILTFVSL